MIKNLLIKPYIDRFEDELNQLEKSISGYSGKISSEILDGIYHRVQQIKETAISLSDRPMDYQAYPDTLRRSKMEIRNVQRQWKRYLVNESKLEKRNHGSLYV